MADKTTTVVATLKNDYVQDKMVMLIIILLLQLGLVAALGGFIFYQMRSYPRPIFFEATERKQVIKPVPLDEPFLSPSTVLNWAVEAVRVSYSFNYRSINDHLPKLFSYFDQRGITKFFEVVTSDNNMKQIKPEQLIVSVQIKEAPKIVKEGKIEGHYAWRINLPVELHLENAISMRRQELDLDLYIWRVPATESPIGIKITNFRVTIKREFAPQAINKPQPLP